MKIVIKSHKKDIAHRELAAIKIIVEKYRSSSFAQIIGDTITVANDEEDTYYQIIERDEPG